MIDSIEDFTDPVQQSIRRTGIKVQNNLRFRRRVSSAPDYDLSGQNVLFLVVDCLRADHVSPNIHRETTPFLAQPDNFCSTAISAAPWTFSSVPSILSGLYPHNHGAVYERTLRNLKEGHPPQSIRKEVYTLPEVLASAGYDTHLITAIDLVELPLRGRFHSRSVRHNGSAHDIVQELLSWWDSHDESPRFAYVHLADLHEPLQRPDRQPFGDIPDIQGLSRWKFTRTTKPEDEFEQYRRERVRLYDTVLRTVDRELERLFHRLESRDELDETIVIITGDHGEEFWERRALERDHFHDPRGKYGVGHGHALVPEVLEVPLVISGINTESANLVSTIDITPTVLSEIALSRNDFGRFDGVPLTESPPDRTVLAEEIAYGYDQQAVINEDHHLIHSPHEDETIVLDRNSDELVDEGEIAEDLLEYLPADRRSGNTVSVDSETRNRLSDLGYL
jgi:arylsulfatase A-like enzyme